MTDQSSVSFDLNGFFNKIIAILTKPVETFQKIKDDGESSTQLLKSFAIPLILISALISFGIELLFGIVFSIVFSIILIIKVC